MSLMVSRLVPALEQCKQLASCINLDWIFKYDEP